MLPLRRDKDSMQTAELWALEMVSSDILRFSPLSESFYSSCKHTGR